MSKRNEYDLARAPKLNRRRMLQSAAGLAAVGSAGMLSNSALAENSTREGTAARPRGVVRGNIQQSIVHWCFSEHWDVEQTCEIAKQLGVTSIELVSVADYPTLRRHGLTNAIAQIDLGDDPPFMFGYSNAAHHERVIEATRQAIRGAAEFGYQRVICFTGYKYQDPYDPESPVISDEQAMENCVAGLKQIIGYAEEQGIVLCLEQLNTRDDSHPMKGHPGYQGDDIDFCAAVCRAVDSPNMKLLFDIYHVQIMHGDIIRRIRQYRDLLGHIHTAGNPDRAELDQNQEINYVACMKALLEVGYDGYVGQEFIPTGDPLEGLRHAVELCDV